MGESRATEMKMENYYPAYLSELDLALIPEKFSYGSATLDNYLKLQNSSNERIKIYRGIRDASNGINLKNPGRWWSPSKIFARNFFGIEGIILSANLNPAVIKSGFFGRALGLYFPGNIPVHLENVKIENQY